MNNLERINFEGLTPGEYSEKPEIFDLSFLDILESEERNLRRIESPVKRGLVSEKPLRARQDSVRTGYIDTRFLSKRMLSSTTEPQEEFGFLGSLTERETKESRIIKSKDVIRLEKILSSTYDTEVMVTRINELPVTRKQVKEVFFSHHDLLSKVWVFKADPKSTARELTTYYIISNQGIPTGKPIGYIPKSPKEEYPYDVAILGGVVEHAGDPYNVLIENMVSRPDLIFNTAVSIAGIIGDYHAKLTLAMSEFEKYGISIERTSPRKEINERLLAALGIEEKDAEELISACEDLYNRQNSNHVISHGDLHTGNIVTISMSDDLTKQVSTSIKKFGVIDWGSICLDTPYGDLLDFWIHHKREGSKINHYYTPDFCGSIDPLIENYTYRFNNAVRNDNLYFNPNDFKIDSLIQSSLWNLYEMYDPVRKYPTDIEEKARTHYRRLLANLESLENFGFRNQTYKIRKSLKNILNNKRYLEL